MATNPLTIVREDPPSPIEVLLENRRLREHQKRTCLSLIELSKTEIATQSEKVTLLDTAIEQLNEAINSLGGFAPTSGLVETNFDGPARPGSAQPARRPINPEEA